MCKYCDDLDGDLAATEPAKWLEVLERFSAGTRDGTMETVLPVPPEGAIRVRCTFCGQMFLLDNTTDLFCRRLPPDSLDDLASAA